MPDLTDAPDDEPYIRITQRGRWLYSLELHHGLMVEHPWRLALGRRHADRKARRMLRAYQLRQARAAAATDIRLDQPRDKPRRPPPGEAGVSKNPWTGLR